MLKMHGTLSKSITHEGGLYLLACVRHQVSNVVYWPREFIFKHQGDDNNGEENMQAQRERNVYGERCLRQSEHDEDL